MQPYKTFQIRFLLIIVFLFFIQTAFSQFNLNDSIATDKDVIIGKLPNGLTYYIRNNQKSLNNIQLRLVVNAGSVLEDDDQQGLAHFMEHMNFDGTKHFPKNEMVNYLESLGVKIGADLNANTSYDETTYSLALAVLNYDNKNIGKGFSILEDWANNALLDTAEIKKERGVVLEESRLHKNANQRMENVYSTQLFNGSKYAERDPIGKDSIIENFKPETLKRFYNTWYRPDLMAVIVVGNIDPSFAVEEIDKHFGKYTNPQNERPRPAIIPVAERKNDEGVVVTDKELPNTKLEICNYIEREPAIATWADYRQSMAEALFNTMINERLGDLSQQANSAFLSSSAAFENFVRGYRTFASVAVIGDSPVKDAVNTLVNVSETVKRYGFLQTELDRAKSSLLNQNEKLFFDKDKTRSSKFIQEYVDNYLSGTPIISITDRYNFVKQMLPGITLDDVNALAKKMESGQGKFALLMASEKSKEAVLSGNDLLGLLADAKKLPVNPYQEKVLATSLMVTQPAAGTIIKEEKDAELGTTSLTLSNGITVTLKPTQFKNDDIQMDAWRWGGANNYSLANKENAMNAAHIVNAMGITGFSKTDLNKFLAGKSVFVDPYINPYEEGVEGKCSSDDFATFMQLVYLYFTQPVKDEALFNSYINKQKGAFENVKANPQNYFTDTLIKIEYKNNPWARNLPSAADYDKINLDTAFNIYKQIFSNAYGLHFTFVGDFNIERMKPYLEKYLASLPSSQKENNFTDEGLRPAKGIVEAAIIKGEAKQSQVNLTFTGETLYSNAEILKLKFLAEVLDIKIFEQLRNEMNGIYNSSVNTSFSKRPYEHYTINIHFPCAPENVDKLTAALFNIIKDARENKIEGKYMDKVREMMMKQNWGALRQNEYWLQSLSGSWINKEDPEWINEISDFINGVSARELREAAVKYFDMNNYIKVVLKPE
jgi:zinc protease